MTQPVSSEDPHDDESGGKKSESAPDATLQAFHERNRKHKRRLFDRMAQGVAFGSGKEIGETFTEEHGLYERMLEFFERLQDDLPFL
ncbi:hypothetical protein [Mycobacterium sp. SMC-4]|uniref:hypothetical protein n=1 Tax=Mycobacterium sp. SMC-4 TaxID=2857059 RepID=UPI003D0205E3